MATTYAVNICKTPLVIVHLSKHQQMGTYIHRTRNFTKIRVYVENIKLF